MSQLLLVIHFLKGLHGVGMDMAPLINDLVSSGLSSIFYHRSVAAPPAAERNVVFGPILDDILDACSSLSQLIVHFDLVHGN